MDHQKILVTGSDGLVGRAVVQDLREHGCPLTPVDKNPRGWGAKVVDCEDLGQVISVMRGHDAVIHLAAIPSPLRHPAEVVFRNNIISTYNVLEAAAILGIKKVVLASSISALGFAFAIQHFNPRDIPINEEHPLLSQDAYGLSKMAGEVLAEGFCRRIPDLSLVSLRFTLVIGDDARARYARPTDDPQRHTNELASVFWTFVDVRDAASACRLALAYDPPGHAAFFIGAPDIIPITGRPIEDLLAQYYPGDYPVAAHIRGSASPLDCSKANRSLGWQAEYAWDGSSLRIPNSGGGNGRLG